MDKERIVKELDELVRKLDEDFKIEKEPYACGDLILKVCGKWICWFSNFNKDDFNINTTPKKDSEECQRVIAKTGVINKFYTKATELMDKYGTKYTVQVFPQDRGYLHVNHESKTSHDVTYDIGWPKDMYYLTQTEFTKSEIEELKSREDLAIDWDKVKIEKVSDDDEH